MTDIKVGDRVKVTIEGKVTYAHPTQGYDIALDDGRAAVCVFGPALDTVEKIEPPAEVFKPGDVVRAIREDGHPSHTILALDEDGGYTYVGPVNKGIRLGVEGGHHPITSEHWERVSL